jgi:hypothetical protein
VLHERLICVLDTAVALNVGAAGAMEVAAEDVCNQA